MLLNPAMTIRARNIGGIEKRRERYLTLDEVKTLWQFLDSEEYGTSFQIRAALKIIVLTGVRTGEIRVAKWSEFDFENSLWTIPAENTKTNIVMRIHLTEKPTAIQNTSLQALTTKVFYPTELCQEP